MAYKLCRLLTLMPHACHPGFISCAVVNSTLLCYASDRYLTRLTWPAAVSGERYTSGRRLALMDDCMTEGMACQIWTACLSSKTVLQKFFGELCQVAAPCAQHLLGSCFEVFDDVCSDEVWP